MKGLSFETHFAVDYATSYNTSFDNSYAVYIPTWANVDGKDMIVALKKEGEDKKSGNQNISGSTDNQTMFSLVSSTTTILSTRFTICRQC